MFKLFLLIIIGCLLSVIIRQYCKEFLLLFQLGFSFLIINIFLSGCIEAVATFADDVKSLTAGNELVGVFLKAGFISVLGKLGADVCKESGNLLLESIIDLTVKLMIFVISLPYILKIVDIAIEYL